MRSAWKPRESRRAAAKREKGDALVNKTDEPKFSKVLKAMRSVAKLMDLEANEHSIRRTSSAK